MSLLMLRSLPGATRATSRLFLRPMSSASKNYEYILTSTPAPGVGQVTLNRPKALNALCSPLIMELNEALLNFDADNDIGAIVLTGSERAFAGRLHVNLACSAMNIWFQPVRTSRR